MKPVLCHIGLAKCGSTVLQNVWASSTNYSLYKCEELVQTVKEALIVNQHNLSAFQQTIAQKKLGENAFDVASGEYVVVSNEGFTNHFYASTTDHAELSRASLECYAALLKPCVDRVLLIVRNPFPLLISSYCQDIKQGASFSFEDFISTRRDDMLANLDLASVVRTFRELDAELAVLPLEILNTNESFFWAEYERRTGFPRPNTKSLTSDPIGANITRRETIPLHRQLNRIMSELERVVASNDFPEEKEDFQRALTFSRVWSVRRALSVANVEQLSRLTTLVGLQQPQSKKTIFEFDAELIDILRERFMLPLENPSMFPYRDILETYEASLDAGGIEIS